MKVIVLTRNYPRKNALMNGYFIHQQIRALIELGVDCHVILTYNWFPPFGLHKYHTYWRQGFALKEMFFEMYEGVPIHHVPVKIKMPSRIFPENTYEREANAIVRYIRKSKELQGADFLYANFLTDCGYVGALIKKKLEVKLAAIARGDDVHDWPEKNPGLISNLHEVFRGADLLIANSERLGLDARRWFPANFDRQVVTVYNGVDMVKFRPSDNEQSRFKFRKKNSLPLDHKLLLCVAAPIELKGWLTLLDAMHSISHEILFWKLVAVTPSRAYFDSLDLLAEVKKRGLEDKFIFLGEIEVHEMPDCMRAMDAFVLPSYNEGLSNSVLEAMATGLTVITTDVGGHSEVISNYSSGILVPPKNSLELANALRQVLTDYEFRTKLGENARKSIQKIGDYYNNARILKARLETLTNR